VIPLISFALMMPDPVVASDAPVPTTIAAETLVLPVIAENAGAVLATLRTPAVQVVPEPHSRTPKPPEEP
jgi:membrane glycosyltransferase